ncbi:MFS transporter [bacterium]|nr:MFS transporter [bacterium]MBU1993431.1 MFS transporter [bacterium]
MTINKNIYSLGFVSFFTDLASAMITPILPIYIVYVLHDGLDKLGLIIAAATFVSYSFRILFGYLSDKFQIRKPFIVLGYLLSAITKPLFAFASSYQSIAVLQSTERLGKAIRSAPKDSLISYYAKKNESGKTFGFHKTMDIAGELFGAFLVFLIFYFYGESPEIFKNIFLLTFIPGLLGVLIILYFVEDSPYEKKNVKYHFEKADFKLFPLLWSYFFFMFFIFGDSFFIIIAKEAGYLTTFIPVFIIVLTLTQTVLSYYFGLMNDKKGSESVLKISYLFGILSVAALMADFLWGGFVFLGIFTVASLNATRSYISEHAINKASIYGVFYGGLALFSSLGALSIGYIWQYFGQTNALIFSLVGMLTVSVVTLFIKKEASERIK